MIIINVRYHLNLLPIEGREDDIDLWFDDEKDITSLEIKKGIVLKHKTLSFFKHFFNLLQMDQMNKTNQSDFEIENSMTITGYNIMNSKLK